MNISHEIKSISALSIINMARMNYHYNTKTSKLNKKWSRYLKNHKLFDEYMVYLSNFNVVGVEPKTYKQLSILCYNLSKHSFYTLGRDSKHHIVVDWELEFRNFAWKSIKWYDFKNIILYLVNNGYR